VILVDTSVWTDHLRHSEPSLAALLNDGNVLTHPDVIGELAMGSLRGRATFLETLQLLPKAPVATDAEALHLVERAKLYSRGLGWVDAKILASALIGRVSLWTRDERMHQAADELGVTYQG
jgi:predicted nucleic acid-binding protein